MNTVEKISVKENKTLKLSNVLIRQVAQNELRDINQIAYMMESYIKAKDNSIIGPLINYSAAEGDSNGQLSLVYKIMLQLKSPICDVDTPYIFEPMIRVPDCLYARYAEKEENIQFAYSKLTLYAFENDLKLNGSSYTVFVDRKETEIVADVFMQLQKGDGDFEDI